MATTLFRFSIFTIMVQLCLGAPGTIAQSDFHRIDSLMKARHQAGEFNGTVLVVVEGTVLYREAFGMAEKDRRLNEDTPFYLGSVSKAFTGMAIMILAEKDKLEFDDQVSKYFPELPGFTESLTIRNLLNHTSGLPDYYNMGKYVDGMTNDMVLKVILELDSLEFEPGQAYSYSNTGYVLLSLLIERVTGNSYRKFVTKQIFKPTGMKHSKIIDGTRPKPSDRARGYTRTGKEDDYQAFTTGAGGIYSQIDDLYLWDQALYGTGLVKGETLSMAFSPARLNSGEYSYYGFGWMLEAQKPRVVQHSGSLAGFRTYFYRDTEKRNTVILLSNNTHDVGIIKQEIVKIIGE